MLRAPHDRPRRGLIWAAATIFPPAVELPPEIARDECVRPLADPAPPWRPERALWAAVIEDALHQARGRPGAAQREALAYLTSAPDCELVCEWAGLDVDVVRRALSIATNRRSRRARTAPRRADLSRLTGR